MGLIIGLNNIELLRNWLRDYDRFLDNDEVCECDHLSGMHHSDGRCLAKGCECTMYEPTELIAPELHPQHLDALEKVLDVAEAGVRFFKGSYHLGKQELKSAVKALEDDTE